MTVRATLAAIAPTGTEINAAAVKAKDVTSLIAVAEQAATDLYVALGNVAAALPAGDSNIAAMATQQALL